jgi:ribosomal protein S18 acetylase RimI-like enzyme
MLMLNPELVFRHDILKEDIASIHEILTLTGFFYHEEIEIGVELALDRLENGKESGYSFLFADISGHIAGYTCFGEIPCTFGSFDLYWIAVHPQYQRKRIGESLLKETEKIASKMGCRRIYIETSARDLYTPTQVFYKRCGYKKEAFLKDYYMPGDGKIIYVKALEDNLE